MDNFATIPGLLLQYNPNAFPIEALYLSEIPPAPPSTWKYIIDDAIRIINRIMLHGIINNDCNPRNALVHWDAAKNHWRVFLIHFGLCEFRKQDEGELGMEGGAGMGGRGRQDGKRDAV